MKWDYVFTGYTFHLRSTTTRYAHNCNLSQALAV